MRYRADYSKTAEDHYVCDRHVGSGTESAKDLVCPFAGFDGAAAKKSGTCLVNISLRQRR